eukprot:364903-Chlamydomonas_euryale.AAC.3
MALGGVGFHTHKSHTFRSPAHSASTSARISGVQIASAASERSLASNASNSHGLSRSRTARTTAGGVCTRRVGFKVWKSDSTLRSTHSRVPAPRRGCMSRNFTACPAWVSPPLEARMHVSQSSILQAGV